MLKKGFLRGAGVIAGVILEKHLSLVCINHEITIRKKYPTISDFNDLLKKNSAIDVPNWRFIQRLGDYETCAATIKNANQRMTK